MRLSEPIPGEDHIAGGMASVTESPAINSSTVSISLIRLSDSLCRYYLEDY